MHGGWLLRAALGLALAMDLATSAVMSMPLTTQGPRLEPVTQWGGSATAVAVAEPYAYLGVGPRLMVLDVGDATAPTELGASEALSDLVRAIEVTGGTAYVAAGRAGLRLFDIGNPARPVEIGRFAADAPVRKVVVQGRLAYLVAGTAGLYVVDVADPRRPALVGRYQPDDVLTSVFISADRAYLGGRRGLHVVNLADPAQPISLGFHALPEPVQTLAVLGQYAYVYAFGSDTGPDFFLLDVTDPASIAEVSKLGYYREAAALALVDHYLFRAGEDGLNAVDVSAPTRPQEIYDEFDSHREPLYHHARDLKVSGRRAYVVVGEGLANPGLYVLDLTDPEHVRELGSYQTPWAVSSVAAEQDRVFLGTGSGDEAQLRIFDAITPGRLAPLGSYRLLSTQESVVERALGWSVLDLAVAGGQVFLATGQLVAIDATDPTNPREVGGLRLPPRELPPPMGGSFPELIWRIVLADHRIYVPDERVGFGYLNVVNVADPRAPGVLGAYPPPGTEELMGLARQAIGSVAVAGSTAFLTAGSLGAWTVGQATEPPAGLHIVDVADPRRFRELGYVATPIGFPRDVAVSAGYAYLVTATSPRERAASPASGYLDVIDVSDPGSPVQVASYPLPDRAAERVIVADGRAYLAGGTTLQVIDVADPAHPVGLTSYEVAGGIRGLAVAGPMLYVAAGSGGLSVLRQN